MTVFCRNCISLCVILLASVVYAGSATWISSKDAAIRAYDFVIEDVEDISLKTLHETIVNLTATVTELQNKVDELNGLRTSCEGVSKSSIIQLQLADGSIINAYCIVGLFNHSYLVVGKAFSKYPAASFLYTTSDANREAQYGIHATKEFSIAGRDLLFKPTELIYGLGTDYLTITGAMIPDTLDQSVMFAMDGLDDGDCVNTDFFYSPDWYSDGKQYGGIATIFSKSAIMMRRSDSTYGDINDLGLDLGISCHSSGDAFSVYRGSDSHGCAAGICGGIIQETMHPFQYINNNGGLSPSSVYSSNSFSEMPPFFGIRPSAVTPVWVALR